MRLSGDHREIQANPTKEGGLKSPHLFKVRSRCKGISFLFLPWIPGVLGGDGASVTQLSSVFAPVGVGLRRLPSCGSA